MAANDTTGSAWTSPTPDPAPRDVPVLLRLLARLPLPLLHALATFAYWVVFRIARQRVMLVEQQVGDSFPTLGAAGRAAIVDRYLRQIADFGVEAIRTIAIDAADLKARVAIEGLEPLRSRLATGQRVLLVAGHCGNWEWMLQALSLELGYPLFAAYKPLGNARYDRALRWLRSRFGAVAVPAKDIVRTVVARRGGAAAIAMLADQVPTSSPRPIWIEFLGRETAFYQGAETIARAARYPVYYVGIRRLRRGSYSARIEFLGAPGDGAERPGEITRRYAQRLEADIRAQPESWLWSHNRWKLRRMPGSAAMANEPTAASARSTDEPE
jgi:KDO2-lipid IV(A) lauroyltransferase